MSKEENPSNPGHSEGSKASQYKKGQSGNPSGLSSQQRAQQHLNGQIATRIRGLLLADLEKKLNEALEKEDTTVIQYIRAEINTMLRDTENRAFGTPVQSVTVDGRHEIGEPGTITRRVIDPSGMGDGHPDPEVGTAAPGDENTD